MVSVNGYTAEYAQEQFGLMVVDADVVNGHLILHTKNGTDIDAGTALANFPGINSIPSGADLNTYQTSGWYQCTANASAAAGSNFPEPYAGLLEVFSDSGFVYQRYTLYSSQDARVWNRSFRTSWSAWRRVVRGPSPYGIGRHSALQAITSGGNQQVTLDATSLEGGMTVSSNNLVVPRAGLYDIEMAVVLQPGTAANFMKGMIWTNGSEDLSGIAALQTTYTQVTLSGTRRLAVGDTIGLWINHNAGSTRNIHTSANLTYLTATWVAD